ncbi:MAG: AAA family ATPase [Candidatus Andersenbacteria bacterium]|nr:AAA family ATPase [Candidatus Andersenbacteria bacterium]
MTQAQALDILKTGANVFLTGEPGAGKTHTINEYVRYLRARKVEVAITASTGIAATHIGGMTIHSWSGVGIKHSLSKYEIDALATRDYIYKRVKKARVLIIDEVSMLSANMLTMVEAICRAIKQEESAFGGLQVVVVGDFFQLPPVARPDAIKPGAGLFAYESPAWRAANPLTCYLTEQHRQDDKNFLDVLSAIRRNALNASHMAHLETRKISTSDFPKGVPKIFSHNADVDRVNNEILAQLPGEVKKFEMRSSGSASMIAALQKGCLSPEELCLKVGAAVMFTKNNPQKKFVNGTLGIVESFKAFTHYPVIKTRSGKTIETEPMDWSVEENGRIKASISQIPLRLAWAITVHKSQGISLDEAVMDLSQVFEFGQGYVALSRVRRLTGLHLLGWNAKAWQVHPDVLARDTTFRQASAEARQAFGAMPAKDIAALHKNFITACGGKYISPKATAQEPTSAVSFEKLRKTHPSAYKKWDDEQDDKLKTWFASGISVGKIAQVLGRERGGIRARLKKHGLLD